MAPALSTRSAGVRRLLQEAAELEQDEDTSYHAAPLEDDLFTWHFTIKGPAGDYQDGIYHGKLVLPPQYPFKPPEIYMLTPSGRFEVNKKICLSMSSFHPESWQPSWGVRTALVALTAFFESDPKGAIGSLEAPPQERRRLAKCSRTYQCATCGFDASDPSIFPSSPSSSHENATSDTAEAVSEETSTADEPATIFPSPRGGASGGGGPASPLDVNLPAGPPVGGNAHSGSSAAPVPANAPVPPMPVLQHRPPEAAPAHRADSEVRVGLQSAAGPGGSPMWVDRAILAVLLALVALIVRKIA